METTVEEPLVEGVYKSLLDYLQISPKRDANLPPVGRYMKDDTFVVFKVFPEEKGIVWGMVSSNLDGSPSKVVPLRVNNHPKAILMKKFASENDSANNLAKALNANTNALLDVASVLRKIAEK